CASSDVGTENNNQAPLF
nr:T-cell receptor V beta CDR3 region {clone V8LK1} [mice, NOD, lymph node, Peptide Partial, 17 aa] [Mus sp.]